jgi:hypothetical protein
VVVDELLSDAADRDWHVSVLREEPLCAPPEESVHDGGSGPPRNRGEPGEVRSKPRRLPEPAVQHGQCVDDGLDVGLRSGIVGHVEAHTGAAHLESAIDAARFRRIEDLYHAHKTGAPIGYGPGADRITQTFNSIQHAVQARGGDATVERAMLRNSRLSIRFGVLNHCAMTTTTRPAPPAWKTRSSPTAIRDRCKTAAGPTAAPTASSQPSTSRSGQPNGTPCSPKSPPRAVDLS